jgi:hypothetical protein
VLVKDLSAFGVVGGVSFVLDLAVFQFLITQTSTVSGRRTGRGTGCTPASPAASRSTSQASLSSPASAK